MLKPDSPRLLTIYTTTDTRWQRPFRVRRWLAPAYQHLIDTLDAIEPAAEQGWDGGHAYRIKNLATGPADPDDWSEHAAGNAIDWNASQHLQNHGRYYGWSAEQASRINKFMKTKKGRQFSWGSNWRHPDPMHFEIWSRGLWANEGQNLNWPEPRTKP